MEESGVSSGILSEGLKVEINRKYTGVDGTLGTILESVKPNRRDEVKIVNGLRSQETGTVVSLFGEEAAILLKSGEVEMFYMKDICKLETEVKTKFKLGNFKIAVPIISIPMTKPNLPEHSLPVKDYKAQEEKNDLSGGQEEKRKRAITSEDGSIVISSSENEEEIRHILIYPKKKDAKKRITILKEDLDTLVPGVFINDSVVSFYLRYLFEQLNPQQKLNTFIFSTHFYEKLSTPPRNEQLKMQEKSRFLTEAEIMHQRVSKWTKYDKLSQKKLIIFPINHNLHWYVLVAKIDFNIEILVLDSYGNGDAIILSRICQYLTVELGETSRKKINFEIVIPQVPKQINHYDCGLYMLQYVEEILARPEDIKIEQWGSMDLKGKRKQVRDLVLNLAKEVMTEEEEEKEIYENVETKKKETPIGQESITQRKNKRHYKNKKEKWSEMY